MPTLSMHRVNSIVLLMAMVLPASAQHKSSVKIQTFRIIDGLYTASFEQAISDHFSLQLSVEAGAYFDVQPNFVETYKANGFGLIGEGRYYPFTKKHVAPNGFFVFAAVRELRYKDRYMNTSVGTNKYTGSGNILNAGGGAGYKFIYRRFGLEAFIGWGAGSLTRHDDSPAMPLFYRKSMDEQKHFAQLDVAVCYMVGPIQRK